MGRNGKKKIGDGQKEQKMLCIEEEKMYKYTLLQL